jgi:hypothetical protein
MQLSAQPTVPTSTTRPNCLVWYEGDPCDQLIQQYHQASQLRQQQEWQNSVTSPLLKQIADQQKQIAAQQNQIQVLQIKIESQNATALQSEARNQEVLGRLGAGLGAILALSVAVATFRRLTRNTTSNHLSSASSK